MRNSRNDVEKKRFPVTGLWCLDCGTPQEIRHQDKPTCMGRRPSGKACSSRKFVPSLTLVEWWRLITPEGWTVLKVNRIESDL